MNDFERQWAVALKSQQQTKHNKMFQLMFGKTSYRRNGLF